jgi:hypothetical protein
MSRECRARPARQALAFLPMLASRLTRLWVVATILFVVVGCASDPMPHASGEAARDFYPLQTGGHWTYELRTGFFTRTRLEMTGRGESPVRDSDLGLFVMEEQLSGRVFGLEPTGLVGYRVEDGFVTRIAAIERKEDGSIHIFGGEGFSFLPVDPKAGQSWTDDTEVFGQSGSRGQRWESVVEVVGRMRVSAGAFDDVILVRSQQYDPAFSESEPLHSYEDYYARGVGLIRSISRNNAQWFWQAVEQELVAVSFP